MLKKKTLFSMIAILSIFLFVVGCGTKLPGVSPSENNSNNTVVPTLHQTLSPTPIAPFTPPVVEQATTVASPQPGSTVGSPFIPGEIMATLPVFPGATPTTEMDQGTSPLSFPAYGAKRPGYQSASAQYTFEAGGSDILGWYLAELGAKGYRHSGEEFVGKATGSTRSIAFYLPSRPLVGVYVLYTSGFSIPPVFELLVVYSVPLPKPPEESLPNDISSVKISYAPDTSSPKDKTLTDAEQIQSLVNMVNSLPVRPDYISNGPPIGVSPQTLFRLIFHSTAQGDITITDDVYEGIHFGDYPLLDDPHNLLQEAVKQMIGVPAASGPGNASTDFYRG